MSNSFLRLAIGSTAVRIERFLNESCPRVDAADAANVAYTASGVSVISGTLREPHSLWNVEAYVSKEQAEMLKLIWLESDFRRRGQENPNVLVWDTTLIYESKNLPTRAAVPNTLVRSVASYWLFFAQFNAVFLKRPEFRLMGLGYAVQFSLQETDPTVYSP